MRISDTDLKKLLTEKAKVKPEALQKIVDANAKSEEPLVQAVLKHKLIDEKELAKLYAESVYVPFIELKDKKIPREILGKIPERIARKYQAVLFGEEKGKLQLAMADPEDFQASSAVQKQTGKDIKIYLATQSDILAALDQYKGNIDTEITKVIKDSSQQEEKSQEVSAKDLSEDAPIAKTVNIILEYAIKSRASDIHIEPREAVVQVRYRIDGILREAMTLPRPLLNAVISRIKILANLKIDEHRVPQDGRFKITIGAKTVAIRVSTLPIMDGEKVVMRLLDESSRALTLEELGFEGRGLEIIKRNLHKPHGMTLVTGPTGSGKSTTLYSVLSLLNTPGVNISTVEDPVEYRIPGVNQTQVNPKAGMTFATGLRALLRQDPNIIMVGEIRDGETADLAVQASLTGHTVLSTLHTNNAATTLPRLLDMGIEPFLIASTVNTVIGQRLVRRLCPVCHVKYNPSDQEIMDLKKEFDVDGAVKYLKTAGAATATQTGHPVEAVEPKKTRKKEKVLTPTKDIKINQSILDKIAADPDIVNRSAEQAKPAAAVASTAVIEKIEQPKLKAGAMVLYKAGPGCTECGQAGYQGRMGIYEVLEVTEPISQMIMSHASSEEIQAAAIKENMLTMQQDGFVKALRGLTTVEEILRVTRE